MRDSDTFTGSLLGRCTQIAFLKLQTCCLLSRDVDGLDPFANPHPMPLRPSLSTIQS